MGHTSDSSKSRKKTTNKREASSGKNRRTSRPQELIDKVPPQAIEIEEAILGQMLLEKAAVVEVLGVLKSSDFYLEKHQEIFDVIKHLSENNAPVDILTVTNRLNDTKRLESVGGPYFVTSLTNRIASATNLEFHCRIVLEKSIRRKIIYSSAETLRKCYDESMDTFELIDESITELNLATSNIQKDESKSTTELIKEIIQNITNMRKSNKMVGVDTGSTGINKITGGWQPGDLIILAARPAMGKTSLALKYAISAAIRDETPTMVFSLEMSAVQVMARIISMSLEIDSKLLFKDGDKLDFDRFMGQLGAHEELYTDNLIIEDSKGLSINQLRAIVKKKQLERRANKEKLLGLIVVDYLQLMSGESSYREQEVSEISRGLKLLGQEVGIPVIALSQLSRAVESRPNKRPNLSDLRESGSIEQDADIVQFLYRPEYYGIETNEDGSSALGVAHVIFAKNRNGSIGGVKLRFRPQFTQFTDFDEYEEIEEKDNKSNDDPF